MHEQSRRGLWSLCSVHSLYTNWQIYRVAKIASLWVKRNHILLENVICVVFKLLFFSLKKVKL